jgi:hypothetical protein
VLGDQLLLALRDDLLHYRFKVGLAGQTLLLAPPAFSSALFLLSPPLRRP